MADNKVDLVLQGHEHLYSLTYPINRDGSVSNINYKNINYSKNKSIKAMFNNNAPIYFTTDAAGRKHHAQLIKNNEKYVADSKTLGNYNIKFDSTTLDKYFSKFQSIKSPYTSSGQRYGMFSTVEVNNNDLIINTYIVDNIKYKKAKLYNSFALTKD